MMILDTGVEPLFPRLNPFFDVTVSGNDVNRKKVGYVHAADPDRNMPIYELMNHANRIACARAFMPAYIAKWDDDDWYSPERLAEQVDLIEATGAACVGYNQAAMYDVESGDVFRYRHPSNCYAIGTSLLYRRSIWDKNEFPETPHKYGTRSDTRFVQMLMVRNLQVVGVSGVPSEDAPRCIVRKHPGNHSIKQNNAWYTASPELAATVRKVMQQ